MKKILTLLFSFITVQAFSQQPLFSWLTGTWVSEDGRNYEHWDRLNDSVLKGFSYSFENGNQIVSEYLEISYLQGQPAYQATVIGQNGGKVVPFYQTPEKDVYRFENTHHDFPKSIQYKPVNMDEMIVTVSGKNGKGFVIKMKKLNGNTPFTIGNTSEYDPALAKELGADDYGMKPYVWVVLKTGNNTTKDTVFINEQFTKHLQNIGRLVKEGKLVVAGPLGKNENQYRGIFVFHNVTGKEEVKSLLQSDAAISSGLLDAAIYDWYGSAALPVYLKTAEKIQKEKF